MRTRHCVEDKRKKIREQQDRMAGISTDLMISRCFEPTIQSHRARDNSDVLFVEYVICRAYVNTGITIKS